jgi:hypothetical protein
MSPFASAGEDAPPVTTSAAPPKGKGAPRGKAGIAAAKAASVAANAGKRIENPQQALAYVAEKFAEARPTESAMIMSMRVHDARGAEIQIKVPTKYGSKLNWLRHKKNLEIIEAAFEEQVGFIPLITFILANIDEAPVASADDGPTTKLDPIEFEKDPLIKQALELFEARIIRK